MYKMSSNAHMLSVARTMRKQKRLNKAVGQPSFVDYSIKVNPATLVLNPTTHYPVVKPSIPVVKPSIPVVKPSIPVV